MVRKVLDVGVSESYKGLTSTTSDLRKIFGGLREISGQSQDICGGYFEKYLR